MDELVARAGVTQSVVSADESAKRDPSFHMMRNLVAAAGCELTIRLSPLGKTTRLRASVNQNGPEGVRVAIVPAGDLKADVARRVLAEAVPL